MKKVFADSHYWIAIVKPGDQWAEAAKKARASLGEVMLVTTDEVLIEFLAALSSVKYMRQESVNIIGDVHAKLFIANLCKN